MTEDRRLATHNETAIDWTTLEKVVIGGDLSSLKPHERVAYYRTVCESLGLNAATSPFEYIKLSGKLTLYPKRDATDQLRRIHRVSIRITDRQRLEDVYIVTACATMPDGRTDESTGVVNIAGLKGDNLANALMKCETKAKRRVTLSICGLGMLDESELDTVRGAEIVQVEQAHTEASIPIPAEVTDTDSTSQFADSLRAAETIAELEAVGEFIAKEQITGKARVALGRLFKKRQAELEQVLDDPEEESELDEAAQAAFAE